MFDNSLSNNLFYFRIDNSGKEMLQEFYFLCTKSIHKNYSDKMRQFLTSVQLIIVEGLKLILILFELLF